MNMVDDFKKPVVPGVEPPARRLYLLRVRGIYSTENYARSGESLPERCKANAVDLINCVGKLDDDSFRTQLQSSLADKCGTLIDKTISCFK